MGRLSFSSTRGVIIGCGKRTAGNRPVDNSTMCVPNNNLDSTSDILIEMLFNFCF